MSKVITKKLLKEVKERIERMERIPFKYTDSDLPELMKVSKGIKKYFTQKPPKIKEKLEELEEAIKETSKLMLKDLKR